jgi:hypothetical protein
MRGVGHLQALLHLRHSARPSRGGHVAPAHVVSLKQPKRPQPCCCCASRGVREPARTTAPSLLREQGSACCRAVRPVGRNALLRYGLFALGPDRAARGAAGRERPGGSGRWARLGAGRSRPKPIPAPRAMRVVGGGWDGLRWRGVGGGWEGAGKSQWLDVWKGKRRATAKVMEKWGEGARPVQGKTWGVRPRG